MRVRHGAHRRQPIRGMCGLRLRKPRWWHDGRGSRHRAKSHAGHKRQPATMRRCQLRLHRPDGQYLRLSLHRHHHCWQRFSDDQAHPGCPNKRRHLHRFQHFDGHHRRHHHYLWSSQRECQRPRGLFGRTTGHVHPDRRGLQHRRHLWDKPDLLHSRARLRASLGRNSRLGFRHRPRQRQRLQPGLQHRLVTRMKRKQFLMNRNTRSNQMTKHFNQSRLWTMAAALALVLGSALLLSGQESKTRRGLPKDWSMHHVVYSKPGANVSAARLQKLQKDPRYILQQELRAAMAAPPSLPAPLSALNDDGPADISPAKASGPLPRGLMNALIPATEKQAVPPPSPQPKKIHKDWSVGVGANGTTGVGQSPATFTQTATPCATDYAVYNTGLGGSSSQA